MSDPAAMDANDLEIENQNKNITEDENMPELTTNIEDDVVEENMPHFTLDMDGSFLVDEAFLINEDFPETSDETCEFVKEELDIDHGEFAEEMDYVEEIRPHASYELHSSTISEQEVPTDNVVQAENPAQETETSLTEVHQSEPISAQSVPVTSHPNASKDSANRIQAQNNHIGGEASGCTSTSVTASANALQPNLNVRQMLMLQRMMRMRQTGILPQRMNVPNIGIPNLRMMHSTSGASQLSLNQQQINFMRLGAPRLPGPPWMQNRIRAPQIPIQSQRPQLNLRFPRPDLLRLGMLQGARSMPSVHVQSPSLNEQRKQQQQEQQKLLQLEIQQQQLQKQQQQLQKQQQILQLQIQQQKKHQQQQIHQQQQQPLMQQGQALQDQLNLLRNFRAHSLRANAMCGSIRPQGINTRQISISQNVLQGRASTGLATSSQQRVQHPLSQGIVPPPPKIQPNVLNIQQRMNMNPLVPNISQLNVNTVNGTKNATQLVGNGQLRVPQIPSNMLQLKTSQRGNVSHLEMQQLVARAQQLARNVTQLSVSQTAANLPQVRTPRLPSNVPQVVSSVSQLNVPHLPSNMPQILRNVQQLCLQQATSTPQLRVPQLAGNVPPLCAPQSPAANLSRFNVPQLSFSQPSSNVSHLGMSLPSASVPNLGLRAGMTNLAHIRMPQSASSVTHPRMQSNMHPVPQMGISDLVRNMPRAPPLTAHVPHVRMPQTTAGVLQLNERYQKIAAPRYERLHRLEFEERQRTLRVPRMGELQVTGSQQIVTGVTQQLSGVLQQSLNSSQQSASAPQPDDGQKLIPEKVSHKRLREQKEEAMVKHIQRRRVRQQLALLNLLKRYERYRVARATCAMKGKKIQSKLKQQRTLIKKHHADLKKSQLIKSSKNH